MTRVIPENEKILFIIRKHWFVLVEHVVLVVFFFILAGGSLVVLPQFFLVKDTAEAAREFFAFVFLGIMLFLWTSLFITWMNYYLDVWVLTEGRVFDIEQHGLFSRDVSEIRLDRIQDITAEVHGVIPTMLNFGHVRVQTAGSDGEFIIRNVPNPYAVRDKISEAVDSAFPERRARTAPASLA